jgi:DnaJ-class molecular chaperone
VATDTPPDAPAEPQPCSPCRGTGKVLSNLGGSPAEVDCPWCEGTGTFIPDHDAQERHRAAAAPAGDPSD